MFGIQTTAFDQQVYEEQLAEFLPDKMIDAHVHLWKKSMSRIRPEERKGCDSWSIRVAADCPMEDLLLSYEQMFPGKRVKPVLMTTPSADLTAGNAYALACAREHGLPVLYCTKHDTPVEEIRRAMTVDGFCGIKPFQNHAPAYIPGNEIRIYDFLPPQHLELMNDLGGIVMLHIPRPGRLRDQVNLAQMMEIDERYPRAKVIIAHIGRAYTPEDIGNAFEVLKNSRHLLFDFTANTLDTAMAACIQAVGTGRLLFGSDMPITKMRMRRITENGIYINVIPRGLYGDVSGDIHMRESDDPHITTFMYEELLAFKRCAEMLSLSRKQVEDILCRNASALFCMSV